MKNSRAIKDLLYEQVARVGKAVSSPKRLELIEVLSQGEKSVEQLAKEAEISVKLASAHLKQLKSARLVETRREGKHIYYRLIDAQVASLWVVLRRLAEERLLELQAAMKALVSRPDELSPLSGSAAATWSSSTFGPRMNITRLICPTRVRYPCLSSSSA